jgi:hypothetical protein
LQLSAEKRALIITLPYNLVDRYIETKSNFLKIKSLGMLGLDEISLKKVYMDFVSSHA